MTGVGDEPRLRPDKMIWASPLIEDLVADIVVFSKVLHRRDRPVL
jgi:hypothetical protein